MNRWEIAANVANTTSILLAAKNSVHLWWTGIIGTIIFIYVFASNQLYADASLQVFFIITSFIGWKTWVRTRGVPQLPVTKAGSRRIALLVLGALPAIAAYGFLLHRYTNAYAPFVDSFVVGASVVAQYLLMGRRIETWPGWLIVNTVSVPLFFSRGLTITAWLYVLYWFNAFLGWWHWRKESGLTPTGLTLERTHA